MTSFRRLLRHEAILLRKDRMAVVLTLAFLLLSFYSIWNGAHWANTERNRLQAVQAAERNATDAAKESAAAMLRDGSKPASPFLDPTNPGVVAGMVRSARYATLPTAPLAALSIGESDLRPAYVPIALQPE